MKFTLLPDTLKICDNAHCHVWHTLCLSVTAYAKLAVAHIEYGSQYAVCRY